MEQTKTETAICSKLLLGALITQKYGTHEQFAAKLGKSKSAWSREFRKFSFTNSRIKQLADLLEIPESAYVDYFFKA